MKRWWLAWIVQWAASFLAGAVAALTVPLNPAVHAIAVWGVLPLLGAYGACRVTRLGVLNYIAWIAPPCAMAASHALIWRFAPDAGPVLLCAFVSLVGAATGEVLNRQ